MPRGHSKMGQGWIYFSFYIAYIFEEYHELKDFE